MQKKKFKVTPLERAWILYDVGNSAFVLMIATLVPIFFNALAEAGGVSKVDYLAYWGSGQVRRAPRPCGQPAAQPAVHREQ